MIQPLHDIETRAAAIGKSLYAVFIKAGIAPSCLYRWKSGEVSPTLRSLDKLTAALTKLEGEHNGQIKRRSRA